MSATADGTPWRRLSFVGGKGGVGKTTCAAALALGAARRGGRVLCVSTDPAHSLGDALALRLGPRPRKVPGAARLHAAELDAARAFERWIAPRRPALRLLAERGTYLERADVDQLLALSLPGVDELVSLVEIAELSRGGDWDEIVVDMAPTGHALKLLAMPELLGRFAEVLDDLDAKHRALADALGRGSRRDAAAVVIDELDAQATALEAALRDRDRTGATWVLHAEVLAVRETEDALAALARAQVSVDGLVLNRVLPAPRSCALCRKRFAYEQALAASLAKRFAGVPLRTVPELPDEPVGVRALGRIARVLAAPVVRRPARPVRMPATERARKPRAPEWAQALAPPGRRLLFFAGKGGVGKTTCAATAAITIARARPRERVLLLSVDPAHSLADVLGQPLGDEPRRPHGAPANLRARELDAQAGLDRARTRFRREVDDLFDGLLRSPQLDASLDRKVMRDLVDLAPPGVDELLGIASVVDALEDAYDRIVIDTAPTGHALRLLEAPELALRWVHTLLELLLKYRKAVGLGRLASELLDRARELKRLRELLADPRAAAAVVVTRPGTLPARETERLGAGLDRLSLSVAALVVNGWRRAAPRTRCARCLRGEAADDRRAATLVRKAKTAVWRAPATTPPPIGAGALESWGGDWEQVRA